MLSDHIYLCIIYINHIIYVIYIYHMYILQILVPKSMFYPVQIGNRVSGFGNACSLKMIHRVALRGNTHNPIMDLISITIKDLFRTHSW